MQEIEIEFKNILTEEEFTQLVQYFQIKKVNFILQSNDYFDTVDFQLKQLGCALRIRKKGDSFELTLKEPHDIGLLETNQMLTMDEVDTIKVNKSLPHGHVRNRLHILKVNPNDLLYFGTLSTERAELNYKNGLLVFDKSFYLGKIDFELEYEVTDPVLGEEFFNDLLKQFNIPRRKTKNKILRLFLERQKQME